MLTVFRMHMAFPSVLLGFSVGWITATANAEMAEVVREYHRVALTAPAQLHAHIECLGEQSGAWGTLHDGFEGWAYPFKLFEELQLSYSIDGGKTYLHQETLARTQIAEPHMARILIADDHCRVEQILFTPRSRPGIAILLNVDTQRDLRIRMRLRPRLDPMLINGNGRFQSVWHKQSKTLRVRRDSAPNDASLDISFPTNTTHQRLDDGLHEFQFMVSGGTDEEMISVVFAAEHSEGAGLADTQMALSDGLAAEIRQAKRHYDQLLDTCPSVISPDRDVNQAMLWSVISLDQLRVNNPDLGRGLVSGYSSSSTGTRPRYAWFFDEPTLASHAYLRVGLNEHVREAFRMLQQYQRTDGKTVHEISQSIRFQPEFFDTYKYAYVHTDGPVYFLAAYGHYYRSTGDMELICEHWPKIKKTFDWCVTRLDESDGLITVDRDDWGTVEVGAAIRKDTQLQAMWIKALRETIYLADVMNDPQLANRCRKIERRAVRSVESELWDEDAGFFLWGLAPDDTPMRSLISHHGIGIWMGSHSPEHARRALQRMASSDFRTDWGVRSLSTSDPRYSADAYQTGTVWPVWNAGVIVGDFQYGRHHDAYRNWRSMIDLRQLDALGPMPEVLHGRFCKRTKEGVPHQMFSEIAIQNGFYDGLLGMHMNVPERTIALAPSLPASWPNLKVRRVPFGEERLDLELANGDGQFRCRVLLRDADETELRLSPNLPAGSEIKTVCWNGQPCDYEIDALPASVRVAVTSTLQNGNNELSIEYRNGIDFQLAHYLLHSGQTNRQVRLISARFVNRTWRLQLEGVANVGYHIDFHADRPPQHLINGRVIGQAESVYRVESIAPDDAVPVDTRTLRWETHVHWPKIVP